jgi:hypothetical protein
MYLIFSTVISVVEAPVTEAQKTGPKAGFSFSSA